MPRFYLPPAAWHEPTPRLDAAESHHALEVLRLKEGAGIVVFDGQGTEAAAKISAVERKTALLQLGAKCSSPPLSCAVTLAQAIPKGKNMDLIIQKAVELGAARIAPLLTERTVVQLSEAEAARKRDKWRGIALEACKQCGQNRLPEIDLPVSPTKFFAQPETSELRLIGSLESDARTIKDVLAEHPAPGSVTVLVGPEGDFTPAEVALAKSHGAHPITLGPIVLRTETAALYCLSVLAHELFR